MAARRIAGNTNYPDAASLSLVQKRTQKPGVAGSDDKRLNILFEEFTNALGLACA